MDDAVSLLERLVSIPSVTGQTGEAAVFLRDWCTGRGLESVIDRGALVVNPRSSGLLLLGHLDTVPGDVPVRLEDGELWGRGAVDAKGPLCAALSALAEIAAGGSPCDAALIAVPDEEGDSATAYRLRDELEERPVIVLEPSGWDGITVAYRGRLLVDMEVSCPPGHSGAGSPFSTEKAFSVWSELGGEAGPRILQASGGTEHTRMRLDFRYPEGGRPALPHDMPGVEFRVLEDVHPYSSDKNSGLVRSFLRSIRDRAGEPSFKRKTGTADMNVLGERWKSPMVAYGPGDGRLDHTMEERISLEEYRRSVGVLKGVLASLTGGA